jgi:hypothetical protein
VAATYCIILCLSARVNSNEDVTVGLYRYVQQVPRAYLPPTWTEPTYSQHIVRNAGMARHMGCLCVLETSTERRCMEEEEKVWK